MNARWTWRCAALSLKEEIDYVLVRNINNVKDVGVLTSINAGSDHRLLRCVLKTQQTRRLARPYQGSRTENKLLLRQHEQQLIATSLSGEVNEDHGMITFIINAATDKATSYVPVPPRISQRTEKLFALRKNLRYGEDSRKQAVEYAEFLNKVISTKTVPKELAYADTILLYEKGDSRDIANYRPISLLSTIYKAMTKILCRRLEKVIDELSIFPPEQAGFRKNFSAVDHIHTLDTILEKSYEYDVNLCLMFVDFTKAFDRVELPAVWQTLETFGIEQDLIRAIQLLYANGTAAVKVGSRLAEINIQRGVRQGDSLSPLLFILTLQCALNNIRGLGKGFRMNGTMLTYLTYADDAVLLAHDCEELQALADALVSETSRIGLAVNTSKTKWMKNSRAATDMEEESIEVNGEKIERVVEFV
ncbi:hypothetical protein Y032_0082g1601 [Ancylostoma ceylanicum]|uniref:Reverse transcriptase domain-containing protein n=1 Tax=Ancylostoma ceylanicum TaxID=53326 RepID=A0A016TRU8_9BILA|nr:hypothetical protein Y032_0082g1601 [Ancylostoma ceylanicum]